MAKRRSRSIGLKQAFHWAGRPSNLGEVAGTQAKGKDLERVLAGRSERPMFRLLPGILDIVLRTCWG